MISSDQVRAARALLRLDQSELARRALVSLSTLRGAEAPGAIGSRRAMQPIQRALEAAGVQFTQDGVRRRRLRTPEEKQRLFADIMEIAKRSAKLQAENPGFSESDLYDDNGLPV